MKQSQHNRTEATRRKSALFFMSNRNFQFSKTTENETDEYKKIPFSKTEIPSSVFQKFHVLKNGKQDLRPAFLCSIGSRRFSKHENSVPAYRKFAFSKTAILRKMEAIKVDFEKRQLNRQKKGIFKNEAARIQKIMILKNARISKRRNRKI